MSVQPVPPSVEYCQVPLVLSMAVMANPSRAPGSTSVMRSPPAEVMMAAIVSPALLESSSLMAVRLMAPVLSSTGASGTLLTVMFTVATFESRAPSLARYVKVSTPEKFAAGV